MLLHKGVIFSVQVHSLTPGLEWAALSITLWEFTTCVALLQNTWLLIQHHGCISGGKVCSLLEARSLQNTVEEELLEKKYRVDNKILYCQCRLLMTEKRMGQNLASVGEVA